MPERFTRRRLASFQLGLATLWLALASPLDTLGNLLLSVHMTQHILIMMVAPPLLLLGLPGMPLLMGLPRAVRRHWIGPFIAWPALRRIFHGLTHPVFALTAFTVATWAWHVPVLYELALQDPTWHKIEHVLFLGTALLFWWPVIEPWPSRSPWPRWAMIPYLLLADIQNTVFSAFFSFYETPIYETYRTAPRIVSMTALEDQSVAGAIMWVPGSIIFLFPVAVILRSLLHPRLVAPEEYRLAAIGGPPLPPVPDAVFRSVALPLLESPPPVPTASREERDLLRIRGLGPVLSSLAFRRTIQWILLLLAVAVVLDGLLGPDLSPMNLAGVLPWTHWRGIVVLGLLLAGNIFCAGCPFMLPRELGKRIFKPTRPWPRWLRSKWIAVALLILFLWTYEVLGLWDSPWLTAWVIIAYFLAATVVDSFFRGASFCKYICPIGQFHFVQSTASPHEVRVRNESTCSSCSTHDCISGRPGDPSLRGCELDLFQPRKIGNMDCTFCLDCVRACPNDNIGILATPPGRDLIMDPVRSSVGRLSKRWDLGALVAVLVFGAFANAIGMVGPVLDRQVAWASSLQHDSIFWIATWCFLAIAVVAPLALLPLAGLCSRAVTGRTVDFRTIVVRMTLGFAPLGFAMWLVHMLFHFVTSWGTIVPAFQRVFEDLGTTVFGEPIWAMSCCGPMPSWLLPLEILLLDLGLLLSLFIQYRIARQFVRGARRELAVVLPWCLIGIGLFVLGIWIIFQPMQMRGTLLP
tara:strand:+ start:27 stop:2273 length:2247 start_codon:yes stop_codon:yes gene_type:complete